MKRHIKQLLICSIALALIIPSLPVLASEDFNPNYIISDEEIQNSTSMKREDIQAFLVDYNSYLASFRSPDINGVSRTASDIIYRASLEHRINPKYLLVKLQKEQSLLTTQSPTQKQLDWATGYGICDSCSMNDPALQKHKGFGIQVDSAAAIIRWYYDNLSQQSWIKRTNQTYNIDGTLVRPTTLATAFLYTYTPHIHGNQNFWNLWQKWFEAVYPDGSLVKSSSSATIYLIQNSSKRPFKNMSALITRFDPKYILTIPEAELNNFATGTEISLPNYSILKNGSNYYLLDYDSLRPFASYNVVKNLGYHPDEIIEISSADIGLFSLGKTITEDTTTPLGRVLRIKENKQLYFINDGKYYSITDENIAKINYPNIAIENASATELANFVSGEPLKLKDGTLFGITGSNKIYVVATGKKRHIASEDIFNSLGYSWTNIIWVDEFTGLNHPTGQPLYVKREIQIADTDIIGSTINVEPVNEKMITTPANLTKYIGQQFDTNMDTYLIADYNTSEILAGKNIDTVRPLASFAKVMTAYQLMKEGINLNGSKTYQAVDHKATYHSYRIVEGERVYNRDLLYAGLISSLNTPMKMLVDSVEEDETKFIERINATVKELGLTKTTFDSVTGESLGTKSTAREYLKIYTKAINNNEVYSLLGLKSYQYDEIKDIDGKPQHYDDHTNLLAQQSHSAYNIINSKTGYLEEAGDGLVMLIQRHSDAKKFLIITMGNSNHNNKFAEPSRLTDWTISSL
ncbi:MAG: serine hydrolase [bacterium]|nr:serine hydrolase [bacterium]